MPNTKQKPAPPSPAGLATRPGAPILVECSTCGRAFLAHITTPLLIQVTLAVGTCPHCGSFFTRGVAPPDPAAGIAPPPGPR
ncbi:MAG TPA: hypothetical protein VKY74_01065 [Chloroflexia bacterium]|nr:hypothetical protein [Chloroflexia bacterium]